MDDPNSNEAPADDGVAAAQAAATQEDAAADVTGSEGAADAQADAQAEAGATVDANAEALAAIAAGLADRGLAPEGDYVIAEVAIDAIDQLRAELAAAQAALTEANGKLEAAQNAPQATKGKRGSAVRAINAGKVVDLAEAKLGDLELGEGAGPSDKLLAAIRAAETVQVAFSNGKNEVAALDPVDIAGDAWRVTIVGVQLTLPELILHGPGHGGEAIPLAGYGLLLNGKLVAYRDRGDQLSIGAGARMNVAPDIVF